MRRLSIFIVLSVSICFFSCSGSGCNCLENAVETNIYLVRHSEKADDGTKDPALTEIGADRSERLAAFLSDANIKYVYSTDYQRTKETAAPLATAIGATVNIYDPRDLSIMAGIVDSLAGNNILIVGHSNTTPTLTNLISGDEKYQPIDESDYSNLFVLTKIGNRVISQHLHL